MKNKNKEIKKLFRRYQQNDLTGSERKAVDSWFSRTGSQNGEPVFKDEEHEHRVYYELKERLYQTINTEKAVRRISWNFTRLAVACSIIFALLSGTLYFFLADKNKVASASMLVIITARAEKTIRLPDGSQILMGKGSSIRYPLSFKGSRGRTVHLLKGKAFFQVMTDSAHAFTVHYKQFRVRVLGTSFTLDAGFDNTRFGVFVSSGKVRVEEVLASKKVKMLAAGLIKDQSLVLDMTMENTPADIKKSFPVKHINQSNTPGSSGISLQQLGQRLASRFDLYVQVNHPERDTQNCTIDPEETDLQTILDQLYAFADVVYDPISKHLIINPKPLNP